MQMLGGKRSESSGATQDAEAPPEDFDDSIPF